MRTDKAEAFSEQRERPTDKNRTTESDFSPNFPSQNQRGEEPAPHGEGLALQHHLKLCAAQQLVLLGPELSRTLDDLRTD